MSLIGVEVDVVCEATITDERARHWWQGPRTHRETRVLATGRVVDRAGDRAEYLVAYDDGRLRWHWSQYLRVHR